MQVERHMIELIVIFHFYNSNSNVLPSFHCIYICYNYLSIILYICGDHTAEEHINIGFVKHSCRVLKILIELNQISVLRINPRTHSNLYFAVFMYSMRLSLLTNTTPKPLTNPTDSSLILFIKCTLASLSHDLLKFKVGHFLY